MTGIALTKENCIAFRDYEVAGKPGAKVTLLFAEARLMPTGGYRCDFKLTGEGIDQSGSAHGINGLQALLTAFFVARELLGQYSILADREAGDLILTNGNVGYPTWSMGESGDEKKARLQKNKR